MEKNFSGGVLFLDRSDINTDEIIPAKYLTEITKEALKPHLLEDIVLDGFDPKKDTQGKSVVVTRANFGCGSSREHAAWVLEVNGINAVIGENFARIFRQNMFNCGLLCVELPPADLDAIFAAFAGREVTADIDLAKGTVTIGNCEQNLTFDFNLAGFDRALIESGGWVDYADKNY